MASQLNSGPWASLKDDRRKRWRAYGTGWDAAKRGQVVQVPAHFTPEEKEEVRKGWTAARRLADEIAALEAAWR